ncbi:MAG: transketolase family protein [Clostridia bacterium]|nr:transketolase family protein [Clostridia bacterium]
MAEKKATREALGDGLKALGASMPELVVLTADLAETTRAEYFRRAFPERFFNCGIQEENMMGVAAGLAAAGKTVFATTFAMFAAGRAFEQIRNSIAYPGLNVKIAATHAGISVGEDGASHQCNEDIGLMRTLPGMTIVNPADYTEGICAVEACARLKTPCYLRFGRAAVPDLSAGEAGYRFELGRGRLLREGTDVTVIATGLTVSMALEAAKLLANEGISAEVINIHTIKPLDAGLICRSAAKTGCVLTAEEHNIIGGLGSAVAEALSENCPVLLVRAGMPDCFGESGSAAALLEKYGLTPVDLARQAKAAIARKKA